MTLIVDASVAVLWVLQQDGSKRARALHADGPFVAPSLIVAEVGNALWKAVRRGETDKHHALLACEAALGVFDALVPMDDLQPRALELAVDLDHPIYDCFYVALAERERAPLVTADTALLARMKKMKSVEVRAL